ncbi:conserved hypothetical protein [Roseovarius sp. EC-HK134]|nr:hypothetical protein [Roseovarius sp. EC-SD190]VVT16314.1 conserved hypothetical protein [Roseovarius sp. EC-HK134]VVT16954.1 conserved hypothetical protein [Roseovarius sp. EC-SD190]
MCGYETEKLIQHKKKFRLAGMAASFYPQLLNPFDIICDCEYYFHIHNHDHIKMENQMAMSARERKQKQLENERRELARQMDATYPYLKVPFFEYLSEDGNWTSVQLCFDLMGFEPPFFEDDRGPADVAGEDCFDDEEQRIETFKSSEKSIGRAEVMMDLLLDAAMELSGIINSYKQGELQKRRQELEQADLSDPEQRSMALQDAAEIARLQEELQKNVRRTFQTWRVKVL